MRAMVSPQSGGRKSGLVTQVFAGLSSLLQVSSKPGEERRQIIRVRCHLKAHCVTESGQMPAEVLDIGMQGLRMELPLKLAPKTEVQVHLLDVNQQLESEYAQAYGTIRWCRKQKESLRFEAGIQFLEPPGLVRKSWINYVLQELGIEPGMIYTRRKLIRASASLPVLVFGEGPTLSGTVFNLGVGGCLLHLPSSPELEVPHRLEIGPSPTCATLSLTGVVKQSSLLGDEPGYLVGMEFLDVTPKQLRKLGDSVLRILKDRKPELVEEDEPPVP